MTETKRNQFISLLNEYRTENGWVHDYGLEDLMTDELYQSYIDDYDVADKPVIPRAVADWIEQCKQDKQSLAMAIDALNHPKDGNDEFILDTVLTAKLSSETIARAWLDGYTVEANHE